jgi:tetratricopeptide (TPR) repeat protein
MIEKETFSALVKHPGKINLDAVAGLEATIKAFPYCQISYSMLAKACTGTEKLDETRPRAAAYALSRVALQQLVENDNERYDASVDIQQIIETHEKVLPQNGEDILINIVEQEPVPSAAQLKSEEQRRQQQIIEGFMKKNPRISKQDNNLEPVLIDLSGRVAEEGIGSLETEAFAKILIRQGKIEKAIDLYQKLILKKPEKRNYFAQKLSELYRNN